MEEKAPQAQPHSLEGLTGPSLSEEQLKLDTSPYSYWACDLSAILARPEATFWTFNFGAGDDVHVCTLAIATWGGAIPCFLLAYAQAVERSNELGGEVQRGI